MLLPLSRPLVINRERDGKYSAKYSLEFLPYRERGDLAKTTIRGKIVETLFPRTKGPYPFSRFSRQEATTRPFLSTQDR